MEHFSTAPNIEANTFIYRGSGDSFLTFPLNATVKADLLHIKNESQHWTGLEVKDSASLAEVTNILVETVTGVKTALTTTGDVQIDAPITLKTVGAASGDMGARIETNNGTGTFARVTATGAKARIQPNNGAGVAVDVLTIENDTAFSFQTNGTSSTYSDIKLNQVTVGKDASLALCVYGGNPGAAVVGSDVNITLESGARVDFGGFKEEGNTDWQPEKIKISADSMTFKVKDADSGNVIYLTGVEGNITTDLDKIKVVADGTNNTGDAAEDLGKLKDIVKLNTKGGTDGSNQSTAAEGVTLEQEASDIFDGATATIGDGGTIEGIQITANPNINGIAEMTAVGLHIWRNEINDMNKRLGELRDSGADANGVWARVYNGKAKFGDLSITNKYTAFQFGYDRQIADKVWLGGAISWTDGDNDFKAGGGDSSLLAFTAYGSKLWDNGLYLDVTGKFGRIKNEFDIALPTQRSSADYDTNAVSVSAEAGWRVYPMHNSVFFEPQVEMMYGHVWSADYTTSTDVHVEQDSADTLIGRVGFMLGVECPNNRGNAYVRASVLHDWKGDADFTFSKGGDARRAVSESLGGTWYEYGIGTNLNITRQIHAYADVEASGGGEVETDYRVNFGMRYSW